jgi:hypothetical protein
VFELAILHFCFTQNRLSLPQSKGHSKLYAKLWTPGPQTITTVAMNAQAFTPVTMTFEHPVVGEPKSLTELCKLLQEQSLGRCYVQFGSAVNSFDRAKRVCVAKRGVTLS